MFVEDIKEHECSEWAQTLMNSLDGGESGDFILPSSNRVLERKGGITRQNR